MCHMKSQICWGDEWPIIFDGNLAMACTGHKTGTYRKPVVRVEAMNYDIVENHMAMKQYLESFVHDELGDVPVEMYGIGDLGDMSAQIYVFNHDHADMCEEREPTHAFIVFDVLKDDKTFDRVDAMIDQGIVVNTLTP